MQFHRRRSSSWSVVRNLLIVTAFAPLFAGAFLGEARSQTAASAAQGQYPIGDVSISIPAPPGQGMVEYGDGRSYFDPAVIANNRLMAAFVLEADAPALHSAAKQIHPPYALVETVRGVENSAVSANDFKNLVDVTTELSGIKFDSSFKESDSEFNERMKGMNLNAQLASGNPVILGTFFLKTDAYSFAKLASVTANGTTIHLIAATILLRVKSRFVFVYYDSEYKDEQSPGQVRAVCAQWADAILAANPQ